MEYPRFKLLVLALSIESAALIVALLLSKLFNINLFPLTHNLFRDLLIGTVSASFPFALFIFFLSKKAETMPVIGSLRRIVLTDIRAFFINARLIDIVIISIIAGFAEELLFRGVIQSKFGIIIASILFGLMHFITPAYAVITTIMGFYIGIIYDVYDSLLIPVQMHFIYDLAALIYLKYFVITDHN